MADVNGVSTTGNPARYQQLLLDVVGSKHVSETWTQQQALHEQRMAQMRQDHQNQLHQYAFMNRQHQIRMNNIQEAGRLNTQRWADRQAANDQQYSNWQQQQAGIDKSHEQFLNVIRGEHTVRDQQGNTYQVDNRYNYYYLHKTDKTYIGTEGATDLNNLKGINPDDYEKVEVIR